MRCQEADLRIAVEAQFELRPTPKSGTNLLQRQPCLHHIRFVPHASQRKTEAAHEGEHRRIVGQNLADNDAQTTRTRPVDQPVHEARRQTPPLHVGLHDHREFAFTFGFARLAYQAGDRRRSRRSTRAQR